MAQSRKPQVPFEQAFTVVHEPLSAVRTAAAHAVRTGLPMDSSMESLSQSLGSMTASERDVPIDAAPRFQRHTPILARALPDALVQQQPEQEQRKVKVYAGERRRITKQEVVDDTKLVVEAMGTLRTADAHLVEASRGTNGNIRLLEELSSQTRDFTGEDIRAIAQIALAQAKRADRLQDSAHAQHDLAASFENYAISSMKAAQDQDKGLGIALLRNKKDTVRDYSRDYSRDSSFYKPPSKKKYGKE